MEQVFHELRVGAQEDIERFAAGQVDARRIDQRERGKPSRVAHGKVRRDPAADREPYQVHVRQRFGLEEIEVVIGEVGHAVEPRGGPGSRVAGVGRQHHGEVARQAVIERQPSFEVVRAFQNKERRALSRNHHRSANAAKLHGAFQCGHSRSSPLFRRPERISCLLDYDKSRMPCQKRQPHIEAPLGRAACRAQRITRC